MLCRRLVIPSVLLVALAGCGDDDGGGAATPDPNEPAALGGTLAYVVSECRVEADQVLYRWDLRIQQGKGEPVTVVEYVAPPLAPEARVGADLPLTFPVTASSGCVLRGTTRNGSGNVILGPFQLIAVSPDGSRVAFELTEDFFGGSFDACLSQSCSPSGILTPEEEGIFIVRSDGSGLRRLGRASSVPSFNTNFTIGSFAGFRFSPDGRLLTFVDQGPGPDGESALQLWIQDVRSGARTQLTHLPPSRPSPPIGTSGTCCARFVDNDTIRFESNAIIDEPRDGTDSCVRTVTGSREPDARGVFTIKTSGNDLCEVFSPPIPSEAPQLIETYVIAGDQPDVTALFLTGAPERPITCPSSLAVFPDLLSELAKNSRAEVFYSDGVNLLQLTNFRRQLTGGVSGTVLSEDGATVFFNTAANPFGTNPSENCQLFSISVTGSDLRQLTNFSEVELSTSDCLGGPPGCGCYVGEFYQDPITDTVLFWSSCDPPMGTNPNGGQIFAIRPDGSGLRQLTNARGAVTEPDGTFVAELVGPYAYSSRRPGGLRP